MGEGIRDVEIKTYCVLGVIDMDKKNNYFFSPTPIDFDIVIITGTCRSGKTLLAKLLGSMKNVDYVEEPWFPMMIPVMQGNGMLDCSNAKALMRAITKELMNDIILCRQANFRPSDSSAIWDLKPATEIFERLINLKSRRDAEKYISDKKSTLVYVLAETVPYIDFFIKTFPDCKIIHVIRNGVDVALDIADKRWYSNEELRSPKNNILYRLYSSKKYSKKYYLPWWIPENEEELFLSMSDSRKGLYYWSRLLEINIDKRKEIKISYPKQYKEIKYEDIVNTPDEVVKMMSKFIELEVTQYTELIKANLWKQEHIYEKNMDLSGISGKELISINNLLNEFGYKSI